MAFEGLSDKLQKAFKKLTGKGKLTEQNIKDAMREVRMALLEADVNYLVVKDFIKKTTERCVGAEILANLNAGQQVIKIVNEELTALMGGSNAKLTWSSSVPTIYMLCGLQGAGKTTMAAKLAGYLIKQGKKPLLAACDIYRPAAIKQLQVVGEQVGVPVFEKGTQSPVKTAKEAVWKSGQYAYISRRLKKRDFRRLWIARISAACKLNGMNYSTFINGLKKADIALNRKMLSEIAISDAAGFTALCEKAKAAL